MNYRCNLIVISSSLIVISKGVLVTPVNMTLKVKYFKFSLETYGFGKQYCVEFSAAVLTIFKSGMLLNRNKAMKQRYPLRKHEVFFFNHWWGTSLM